MARPRVEINYNTVDKLLHIQCTGEEIASVLGIDYDTLQRAVKRDKKMRFAEYIKQKANSGKASLRRMQWKAAENGNNTMLVWLGKQMLGQTDKSQTEITGRDGGPIEVDSPLDKIEKKLALISARISSNDEQKQ